MKNISPSNHARKVLKRLRRNHILQAFIEPRTYRQVEALYGLSRDAYTNTVRELLDEGYIKNAGVWKNGQKDKLWQAIKFDYREEGIDYENPPKPRAEKPPVAPYIGLGQAVYSHNADSDYFKEKYRDQNKKTRKDKKSARVWAGASEYA